MRITASDQKKYTEDERSEFLALCKSKTYFMVCDESRVGLQKIGHSGSSQTIEIFETLIGSGSSQNLFLLAVLSFEV